MKKLKLTHIFILLTFFSTLLISCGTEEDLGDETFDLVLSSTSVAVGSSITFEFTSNLIGDITAQTVFVVNGESIEGNSFIPTEANESNEVFAEYNGVVSSVKTFRSTAVIPSAYTQKVLMEDYTGTWCGYCPRMATITHYLKEYDERIIPVAIHSPGMPTDPWTYEYAKEMAKPEHYNAGLLPKGKYNRIYDLNQFQGPHPCPNDASVYYPQADEFLSQTASLGLGINSTLSGNSLKIDVKVGFAVDQLPDARLVVYLIEDGLKYKQVNFYSGQNVTCDSEFNYTSMPNPIMDFPQEHVLLKAYTDIYGDIIPQNQIGNGQVWEKEFNVELPANVTNANNLKLVAFVLGNGSSIKTRPVINVQSAKVGVNQDFD
ncbi:MAG TPA: Omp28-related outer membrane protein [Moheibacter sp.]|nr:Omp28-related outer membrane protein [Moheibacter sp.]